MTTNCRDRRSRVIPSKPHSDSITIAQAVSPEDEVEMLLAGFPMCLQASLGMDTSDQREPECCRHRSLRGVAGGESKCLAGFGQRSECEVGNGKMPRVHGPNRE